MSAISFGMGRKQICGVVNHMWLFYFIFSFSTNWGLHKQSFCTIFSFQISHGNQDLWTWFFCNPSKSFYYCKASVSDWCNSGAWSFHVIIQHVKKIDFVCESPYHEFSFQLWNWWSLEEQGLWPTLFILFQLSGVLQILRWTWFLQSKLIFELL